MASIARVCVACVNLAARVPTSSSLDRPLAHFASRIVGFYQRRLSARAGRKCLFRVSCSCFALEVLRQHGWADGIRLIDERLAQCGSSFTVSTNLSGRVMMRAGDGTAIPGGELAGWVIAGASLTHSPVFEDSSRLPF